MPTWRIHLELGNRINKKLNYKGKELKEFLFASILPDINNGHLVEGVSHVFSHDTTHFTQESYIGYPKFIKKYKDKMAHPIFKGYLAHLIADGTWNQYFYNDFFVKNIDKLRGMDKEQLRIIKQADFRIYGNRFEIPSIEIENIEEIVSVANQIEEININVQDIEKALEYLKMKSKERPEEKQFNVMSENDFEMLMQKTVEDSINNL